MELLLQRDAPEPGTFGTFGKLYVDGVFQCDTLERIEVQIPSGRYSIYPYNSPRFHRRVLLFSNVPQRTMIEIHAGNTIADTAGCILVGKRTGGALWHSVAALDALLAKVTQTVDIVISDAKES